MERIILRNAELLDCNFEYEKKDLLISSGSIAEIGDSISNPGGAAEIDLNGYTLCPGLINAHTHIILDKSTVEPSVQFKKLAKSGLAAVHDLGFLIEKELDECIADAEAMSGPEFPELNFSGKYIASDGGYGSRLPGQDFILGLLVETPGEAERAVDYLLDAGCHGIKIGMDKGRYEKPEDSPELSLELIKAICGRARARGTWIAAHVNQLYYLRILLDGGITEMAHQVRDELIPEELMQEMLDKNIYITPTLVTTHRRKEDLGEQAYETAVENTMKYFQAGGLVAVGTDYMVHHEKHDLPIDEMRLLKKAGMSVRDVIIAATLNGARICGYEDRLGSIEIGKSARLIAVKGRIDDEFNNFLDVKFVLNKGVVLKNAV